MSVQKSVRIESQSHLDRGFSWVVAVAGCMASVWIVAVIKGYSRIYIELIHKFPDSTAYELSFINVMLITSGLLSAPVVAVLFERFGSRILSSVGALLCFSGLLLSSFSKTVPELVLSLGVLSGIGCGFVTTPAMLIVNTYFDKRRAIASAICVSGNAIGGIIGPPFLEYLLQEYGLEDSLLICAALQLNILVSAFLYRPISQHIQYVQKRQKNEITTVTNNIDIEINNEANSLFDSAIKSHFIRSRNSGLRHQDEEERYQELQVCRSLSLTDSAVNLKAFSNRICQTSVLFMQKKRMRTQSESVPKESFIRTYTVTEDLPCLSESMPDLVGRGSHEHKHSKRGHVYSLYKSALLNSAKAKPYRTSYCTTTNSTHGAAKDSIENMNALEFEESCSDSAVGKNEETIVSENIVKKILSSCFDRSLMKSTAMILSCVSNCFACLGLPHATFYLHAYFASLEINSSIATKILSLTNIVDLFGRLIVGYVVDLNIIPLRIFYFMCVGLAGLSILIFPFFSNTVWLTILMCGYGFGMGGFMVLVPTSLARRHGISKLPTSYCFIRMLSGVMFFVAPQILGAMIDATGSYAPIYYFMGASLLIASVLQKETALSRAAERQ